MPVPTTAVSFSSIQTEFGGANPISISEYYRGGVNVPAGQATSATDGVAVAASGAIRVGTFRGLSKAVNVNTNTLSPSALAVNYSPNAVGAGFRWNTDGTITRQENGSNASPMSGTAGWYNPTTAGIGNSFWISFEYISGNTFANFAPGWLPLSSPQQISLNHSGPPGGLDVFFYTTYRARISTNSSGTNIVGTNTFSIQIEWFGSIA